MAKPLPGQPGYVRRDWNNWDNLDAAELAERRRVLQKDWERLGAEAKEVARERDENLRELREFRTKEYGFERTIKILSAIIGDEKPGLTLAQDALRELLHYRPEGAPKDVAADMKESGTNEVPPFFTEAFLYPLLGKDAARSVLARIRALKDALGYDDFAT